MFSRPNSKGSFQMKNQLPPDDEPESPDNIVVRCPHHRLQTDPKYLHKPLDWFIGKHCKLDFKTDEGGGEYMWVKVSHVARADDEEELIGFLDNDPQVIPDLFNGDIIEFSRNEIIDVYDHEQQIQINISGIL